MRYLPSALLPVLLITLSAGAQEAELPTPAEIQKQIDGGQYRDALKNVNRVLVLTGPAAVAYDKYDLLMFRAECELQVKQQAASLASLQAAKKQAFADDKPERAIQPMALAFLIQHSHAYQYTPKNGTDHKPISILDRAARPQAFAALLADELPAAKRRVKALEPVKSLTAVMDVAAAVGPLHALELASGNSEGGAKNGGAATGDQGTANLGPTAPETDPLVSAVADKAAALVDQALTDPGTKVTTISDHANQLVQEAVPQYDPASKTSYMVQVTHRRGPSNQEVAYLRQTGALCVQIAQALTTVGEDLDFDAEPLRGAVANANTLKMRILQILNDNYNDTTDRSQKLTTQPGR